MDKNKNCSACNIKLDKDSYKTGRTGCKSCYSKKRKNIISTLIQNQQHISSEKETSYSQHQPKIDNNNLSVSAYEKQHHVIIGPSNVGITYYMLKVL